MRKIVSKLIDPWNFTVLFKNTVNSQNVVYYNSVKKVTFYTGKVKSMDTFC